jgi:hypothetical protein
MVYTERKKQNERRAKKVFLALVQGKGRLTETVLCPWPGNSNLHKQEVKKVGGEGSG